MTQIDGGASQPRDRSPLGQQVYEELLARIISGRLGAEERITIDAVARDLGVSQTPIREALHRLDADGVVVRAHLAGYRVAPRLTREQFEWLVDTRLLLEPEAARLAASNATVAEVDALRAVADSMTPAMLDGRDEHAYASFSQRDGHLHNSVAATGGNPFVRDAISRLHTHAHLFRLSDRADITELALAEHEAIVGAIVARDPAAAARAMRDHIERSAERFRRAFEGDDDAIDGAAGASVPRPGAHPPGGDDQPA